MTLRRSHDRKVTTLSRQDKKGKFQSVVQNAFGLPAGKAYSCPGATSVCDGVCYAGNIEKRFPGVFPMLNDNFNQLINASFGGTVKLLHTMMSEFVAECDKKGADKAFRIHWDGDFFSRNYASAWATVVRLFPDVQFWVYTRSFTDQLNVVDLIADIDNLSVFLSVDEVNEQWADEIVAEYPSIGVAALSDTMDESAEIIKRVRKENRPGAKCPELIGAIPLISLNGGACISCQLCPKGKADIRFASTAAGKV